MPIENGVRVQFTEILHKHFPNGIRPNSIIDLNKLKKYYFEKAGKCISDDVTDISCAIKNAGIQHGDKVYVLSAQDKQHITCLVDKLQENGNRILYYDEFYNVHADFFQEMQIFSSELLQPILSELFPSLKFYSTDCRIDAHTTVESEILRCFETAVILSCKDLKKMLPYIPITTIKQTLSRASEFINVSEGVYTHVSKINFDKSECHEVCEKIEKEITSNGFAPLASIAIAACTELNPELTETAIKNGMVRKFLGSRFKRRGNIVTSKETTANATAIFENFCRTHDRLTLKELFDFEEDINGKRYTRSLFTAYNIMVRIDRDTFIADGEIQFDVGATDNALGRFFHGEVIPLRAVSSFMSFPYIERYQWNLFLLESYCRRFSNRFSFQCLSVSSKSVGAIIKKSANFCNYTEALATAVAAQSIKITTTSVADFLFHSGYIARRTGFVEGVVERARLLRERIS